MPNDEVKSIHCLYIGNETNHGCISDDEQFIDEKAFLTKQIESLQPLPRMISAWLGLSLLFMAIA